MSTESKYTEAVKTIRSGRLHVGKDLQRGFPGIKAMHLTILNEYLRAVQIGFKNPQCLRIRVRDSIEPSMPVRFRLQKGTIIYDNFQH